MSDSYYRIASPFDNHTGTLLLQEPSWTRESELRARLLDGTYSKPFVLEDASHRYLYFSISLMQSGMALRAPNALDLRYTQKMMSFLLFNPHPRRLVLIGLGGGSLIKFCYYQMPGLDLTAVELSPEVIAFREAFQLPGDGPRLRVLNMDGAEYIAECEKGIDVLLLDAFDATGFAPGLANRPFLANVFEKLAGSGILVINLAGEKESYAGLIDLAMQVFDEQVLVVPVPEDGNHILFAFKTRHFEPRWRWLHNFAKELRAKFGLDFPAFVQKLERAAKLDYARREALRGR